jgi:hypothetical protein
MTTSSSLPSPAAAGLLQALKRPLHGLGLSHFWVVEKVDR